MMPLCYDVTIDPPSDVVSTIEEGLHAFNLAHLGQDMIYDYHQVAVVARDPQGDIIGGAHGELCWGWLHVKTMWVAESHRRQGVGTCLLTAIEKAALDEGFLHANLETTDFQAMGFYVKNGYEVVGRLAGKPPGHTWYVMRKDL